MVCFRHERIDSLSTLEDAIDVVQHYGADLIEFLLHLTDLISFRMRGVEPHTLSEYASELAAKAVRRDGGHVMTVLLQEAFLRLNGKNRLYQ